LLATTAICRCGIKATPIGLEPTFPVAPFPLAISIMARESQPNMVTAAMFCWGSMATPEGSGVGQLVLLRSMLCSTVKSSALVTAPLPLESATSRANRCAEDTIVEGTTVVSSRSPFPTQLVGKGAPSRRILKVVEPLEQVRPLPITVKGTPIGAGTLPSAEVVKTVFGLAAVMENGLIAPRFRMLTLLSVWLATTAMFAPGSIATATGPARVGNKLLSFKRRGVVGSITESVSAKELTATTVLVSGL